MRIKRSILLLTLVGAVLLACTGVVMAQDDDPAPLRSAEDEEERIAGQYIVQFEKTVKDPDRTARQISAKNNLDLKHVYKDAIQGFAAAIPQASLDAVRKDPRVRVVEEDTEMRIDAQQQPPTGVDRMEAERSGAIGSDGITRSVNVGVAVIDTGIDLTHPDLNAAHGTNAISTSSTDSTGKLLCANGTTSSSNDDNGHGSHVAGTIGAKDNADGVVGVAPGATVYGVKVLNSAGSGSRSDVTCGIDWVTRNAAAKGIRVANMSLGGTGSDDGRSCGDPAITDTYKQAICGSIAAGVTYVVAAGNSNVDLAGHVPAAYDQVLTVTAEADFNGQPGGGAAATCRTDVDDTAADFSNYATTTADQNHTIAAPGVCINSTLRGGGYGMKSGTSMAAPHVAGMAALYMANNTAATPDQVMTKLRDDASTKSGSDRSVPDYYGFTNDPNSPNGTRYYSFLSYAADYTGGGPTTETTITSGPSGTVNGSASANKFEFSSNKPDPITFQCSLDGAPFTDCTSGQEYPNLAEGLHTFDVKATSAGETDPTPASRTWKVDATAPTVSSVNPSSGATGRSLSTNVTAKFSEAVDLTTVNTKTVMLAQGTKDVKPSPPTDPTKSVGWGTTTVTLSADGLTATLNPYGSSSTNLAKCTWYTAKVAGGTGTDIVRDKAGNALTADKVWSFKTSC